MECAKCAREELDWEVELLLAKVLQKAGRLDEAVRAFELFVKHYPDNIHTDQALFRAAAALEEQGKPQQALEYYRRVVASRKDEDLRQKAQNALKRLE